MIYSELVERVIQGVLRVNPSASRASLLMQIDAAFPQINNQVAEAFAATEDRRSILRTSVALTFASGTATLPSTVLKEYLKDARLTVAPVTGDPPLAFDYINSEDYNRTRDPRLGKWKADGLVVTAERPLRSSTGAIPLVGSATFNCLSAPAVPTLTTETYVGDSDMIPELISTFITFLLGKPENQAAKSA